MSPEPMRVDLSPGRLEVTVGESVVLSCKATHDTSLDVGFQWSFNQRPINFQKDGGHLEYIQTVRAQVTSCCLQGCVRQRVSHALSVVLSVRPCVCLCFMKLCKMCIYLTSTFIYSLLYYSDMYGD